MWELAATSQALIEKNSFFRAFSTSEAAQIMFILCAKFNRIIVLFFFAIAAHQLPKFGIQSFSLSLVLINYHIRFSHFRSLLCPFKDH